MSSLNTKRPGFSLILSLLIMSFMVLLVLNLSTLCLVEIKASNVRKHRHVAKMNARYGLIMALSNLQTLAGPDQRTSASASIEFHNNLASPQNAHWYGIYHTKKGHPLFEQRVGQSRGKSGWLISESSTPLDPSEFASKQFIDRISRKSNHSDYTVILGEGTVGNDIDQYVVAPLIPLYETEGNDAVKKVTGKYGWWIGDEGVKANVSIQNPLEEKGSESQFDYANSEQTSSAYLSHLKQSQSPQFAINRILEIDPPEASNRIIDLLRNSRSFHNMSIAFSGAESRELSYKSHFHDLSTHSSSILSNTQSGGLKINLSDPTFRVSDALFQNIFNEDYYQYLKSWKDHFAYNNGTQHILQSSHKDIASQWDKLLKWHTTAHKPKDQMRMQENLIYKPIITEFTFKLGPFHTRSDNRHRIRYHIELELWNPFPFPILLNSKDNKREYIALLTLVNNEESFNLNVTNHSNGSSFTTDLCNFDETLLYNSIDKKLLSAWVEIPEKKLLAGEVYRISVPFNRAQGLSRTIGGSKDKWRDWTEKKYKPGATHMIGEKDAIELRLDPPPSGLIFRLLPFSLLEEDEEDEEIFIHPDYRAHPEGSSWNAQLKPFLEIRFNMQQESETLSKWMKGIQYSRDKSSSYTVNDYKIGIHARLKDEQPIDLLGMRSVVDLRQPIIDQTQASEENTNIAAAYTISEDPWEAAISKSDFSYNDLFHDTIPGFNHDNDNQRIFFFDTLYQNFNDTEYASLTSIGQLAHLPIARSANSTIENSAAAIGNPWGFELNGLFDKYFYTALLSRKWCNSETPLPLPIPRMTIHDKNTFSASLKNALDNSSSQPRYSDIAKVLSIKGGFNINSTSSKAWESFLGNNIDTLKWNSNEQAHQFKNAFINTAFSGTRMTYLSTEQQILKDSDIDQNSSDPIKVRTLSYQQGIRDLDTQRGAKAIQSSAQKIVTAIQSRKKPFTCIEDFLNAGILHNALLNESQYQTDKEEVEDHDINNITDNISIAPYSPAHINQGTIMTSAAPFMFARSDTFRIRSYGECTNSYTGAAESRSCLEAIVQRYTTPVQASQNASENIEGHGRRFKIISIKWLSKNEI